MRDTMVTRAKGRAGQSLADGQVATSVGTIFECPASDYAMIRSACFYHGNVTSQTLEIYVTRNGGTRRQLVRATVAQYGTFNLLGEGEVLCLSPGDVLEAQTTTASEVDYLITGQLEEDA